MCLQTLVNVLESICWEAIAMEVNHGLQLEGIMWEPREARSKFEMYLW
jgi:hypothetical protein